MVITLIPYSQILSNVLEKYIQENEKYFICNDGIYTLTQPFKINKIHLAIANTINHEVSRLNSSNVYIIGECHIYNNWQLTSTYNVVNPSYKQLLDNKSTIKYRLKETNIKIDDLRFNHICDAYFNKQFKNCDNNIKFLKHRNLTEEDLIYIFTKYFSSRNLNIMQNTSILNNINNLIYGVNSVQIPEKYIKIINCLIENQFSSL
jgi:hypothetical protein